MMARRSKARHREIVTAGMRSLATRPASLISRGLREITHPPRWSAKQLTGHPIRSLSISPLGQVAAYPNEPSGTGRRLEILDIELSLPPQILPIAERAALPLPNPTTSLAWSPCGRYLLAASADWEPAFHFFEVASGKLLRLLETSGASPRLAAWSEGGHYIAASSLRGQEATLKLWATGMSGAPNALEPAGELGEADWLEPQGYGEEFSDEGRFLGYGKTVFSPGEGSTATAIELQGEWSDDFILLSDVPGLGKLGVMEASGHITDLSWRPEGHELLFCAAGQAYLGDAHNCEATPLPFAAELCRCHARLNVCACFSSWLKDSAAGRVFVVDLDSMNVVDECPADGIVDLRWSGDGSKLYAAALDGRAFVYERWSA